jgi:hypothetical protein
MSETIPQPEEEPPPAPAESTPEPEPQPAVAAASKASKRISHLSARANEATRRAEAAERELEQARALLAQRSGETPPAERTLTEADVDALAEQKVQALTLKQRQTALIQAGAEEFGADKWNQATAELAEGGLQKNAAFMETISELDGAHRVIVALSDDPDAVAELLTMRPVAMAARLGRMAAELNMSDKPPGKQISNVPPPVRPVAPGRTAAPPDPQKMSTAQYLEFRKRTAPKHLGGRGEAA